MSNKKELGQFLTTNVDYIFQGFEEFVKNKNIIDPFAGNEDLLNWASKNGAKSIIGYDIDKKYIKNNISFNDSLLNIPRNGNFNLTNPPYLAKNKMSKELKEKYLSNKYIDDFYLLAIKNIINSEINEGIIIVPVNFFSAENSNHLRKEFLSKYNISKINYFKEQVFDDTTYNVVAFHYFKDNSRQKRTLNITSFPDKKSYSIEVDEKFYFQIAGEEINEINCCNKKLKIKRLTEEMMKSNFGSNKIDGYYNDYNININYEVNDLLNYKIKNNIILLNCIDGKNEKICAKDIRFYKKDCLVGKNTSRNIAYIIIENLPIDLQSKIIKEFNKTLNNLRDKYNSLFLTNFRDHDRKRVSFDFCYNLINYCYNELTLSK